jgi:hypothetical protein
MTKDNPEPLINLVHVLRLPSIPYLPKYKEVVHKGKMTGEQYSKLKRLKELRIKERKEFLKPYHAGSYRDYEGDGYFTKPLYLYDGKYYA